MSGVRARESGQQSTWNAAGRPLRAHRPFTSRASRTPPARNVNANGRVARVRVGLVDVVGLKARMTLDLHRDVVDPVVGVQQVADGLGVLLCVVHVQVAVHGQVC